MEHYKHLSLSMKKSHLISEQYECLQFEYRKFLYFKRII